MVSQRTHDLITRHERRPVCNACIREGVGLPFGSSHPALITAALATTSEFIREMGICSICSKERMVIRRP